MEKNKRIDALLGIANKDESKKGKLKIFLGSSPGVGKTYAMLQTAIEISKDGKDIVVGHAVTHNRKLTQSLLEGLELIPTKKVFYKNTEFQEVDVQSIIKRNPDIVIVDELAHSNIFGSSHAKRYLDIQDIIDAGIDVYTAVNVQHIESISQDVEGVMDINVRERVPDEFIEKAEEIVVIDINPEQLIERLQAGHVYLGDMAKRAVEKYFTLNNLSALREFTFRCAALHIGDDVRQYKEAYNIGKVWALSPAIMVCMATNNITEKLLRQGSKQAKLIQAKLIAVFVSRPERTISKKVIRRYRHYSNFARGLGYEVFHITGSNIAKSLLNFAKEQHISDILIGKSVRPSWVDRIFGSIVYDIIRYSGGINVHVVSSKRHTATKDKITKKIPIGRGIKNYKRYLKSTAVVIFACIVTFALSGITLLTTQTMILLAAIAWCAFRYGAYPSLLASFVSFFFYMYIFLSPAFEFTIYTAEQSVTFVVFIAVAIIISRLTGGLSFSLMQLKRKERDLSQLFAFTKILNRAENFYQIRDAILNALEQNVKAPIVLLFDDFKKDESLMSPYPQHPNFNPRELAAAKWCWQYKRSCGITTDTFRGLKWYFYPMNAGGHYVGIVAVFVKSRKFLDDPGSIYLFESMVSQAAYRLLKYDLNHSEQQAMLSKDREQLQKALLSSISHDFRTPLASVIGSLSSLVAYDDMFSQNERKEMMNIALDQAKRLHQYLDKVLQLIKVDANALSLEYEVISIKSLIQDASKQLSIIYPNRHCEIISILDNDEAEVDAILLKQVFINLLDNAYKYSALDNSVDVSISNDNKNGLQVIVKDEGEGIVPKDLDKIFDMFYRITKEDYFNKGTGLGLAICQGIVHAHGGNICAYSDGLGKGTKIIVSLPIKANGSKNNDE